MSNDHHYVSASSPLHAQAGDPETRHQFIEATLRLAARNVSTSLRVADIISEAGSSRAAFYDLFGSKAALFSAVRRAGARHLSNELQSRMKGPPLTKIVQWMTGLLLQANDEQLAARHLPFVIDEFRLLSEESNITREPDMIAGLRQAVVEAVERRELPDTLDVDVAPRVIWFLTGHTLYEHVALRKPISLTSIRKCSAFALRGLGASHAQVELALAEGLVFCPAI